MLKRSANHDSDAMKRSTHLIFAVQCACYDVNAEADTKAIANANAHYALTLSFTLLS